MRIQSILNVSAAFSGNKNKKTKHGQVSPVSDDAEKKFLKYLKSDDNSKLKPEEKAALIKQIENGNMSITQIRDWMSILGLDENVSQLKFDLFSFEPPVKLNSEYYNTAVDKLEHINLKICPRDISELSSIVEHKQTLKVLEQILKKDKKGNLRFDKNEIISLVFALKAEDLPVLKLFMNAKDENGEYLYDGKFIDDILSSIEYKKLRMNKELTPEEKFNRLSGYFN